MPNPRRFKESTNDSGPIVRYNEQRGPFPSLNFLKGRNHMNKKSVQLNVLFLILLSLLFIGTIAFFNIKNTSHGNAMEEPDFSSFAINPAAYGAVGDGRTDDTVAIQKAIDKSQEEKVGRVLLEGNRSFLITGTLTIKEDVVLSLGPNTYLVVEGDFNAIVLEKNASLTGGIIEVIDPSFNSAVISLDGREKFYGIWDTTAVSGTRILNSSGSLKGTAVSLYAKGPNHQITFLNFTGLAIAGFHNGILLEAENPGGGEYSWINGNRFIDISMEECTNFIVLKGNVTVPNETTGNEFKGLQIQLSGKTESVLTVDGSDNYFEGMIWDPHELSHSTPIIRFSSLTKGNRMSTNLDSSYISDKGKQNSIKPFSEE